MEELEIRRITPEEMEAMQADLDGFHKCPVCQKDVINERATVVKHMLCRECTPEQPKLKAIPEGGGKEGEGWSFSIPLSEIGDDGEEVGENLRQSEKLKVDDD